MTKVFEKPICEACGDHARFSFTQVLREGLKSRGIWCGQDDVDTITAALKEIDSLRNTIETIHKDIERLYTSF